MAKRRAILEKNIKGDISKFNICKINFTAIQLCIMCQLRIEQEKELGKKLTREESEELSREVLR